MHDAYIGGHSENNIKCVMHDNLRRRTEQLHTILQVFGRVTGFTSDFLSFILVEHIWFFYRALHLSYSFSCQKLTLLLVGRQEGHPACKKLGVGLLVMMIWSFVHPAAVTTTSVILSSNKLQNGDVLVLANPAPSEKWPLKWRENFVHLRQANFQSA